jgi:hypothetical protein
MTRVPAGITIVEQGRGAAASGYREHAGDAPLIMERHWRRASTYGEVVVVTLCVGSLIVVYFGEVWPRQVVALFVLVGIGFVCSYYFMAMLLNRTEITVTDEWILVRHGPIRWSGSMNIEVARLSGLVCERVEHRSSGWGSRRDQFPAAPTFRLHAELDNGRKKIPIVVGAPDMEQVAFLKQRIERRLAIGGTAESGREGG